MHEELEQHLLSTHAKLAADEQAKLLEKRDFDAWMSQQRLLIEAEKSQVAADRKNLRQERQAFELEKVRIVEEAVARKEEEMAMKIKELEI